MATDLDLLTLAQWLSPAYPVGSFAYSHGLERLVQTGAVADADDLENWLCDLLEFGAGWSDALFLIAAARAATRDEVQEIDAMARAFAGPVERRIETVQQGAAFVRVTSRVWGGDDTELTYPVALGCAAHALGLPLHLAAKMYLHAFVANLVSAAQRLMPLGQTAAQALVHRMAPRCAARAEAALASDLSALSGTAFLAEIAAMQHETQEPRIFRT
ncbi:urease accessory protein UreF [Ruegeria marina]|uniref:Urease accessory protein UreF n=1 Tax=Ruegeria marina TaxID=639004 RepID=A0A1G6Z1I5_9RHOB|nr:urease accessory UreF family protein [Ruegeria marina]SDD95676.1 urease accessory protein [Ruegeria marina]